MKAETVNESGQASTFNSTNLTYDPVKFSYHTVYAESMAAGETATVSGKAKDAAAFVDLPGGAGLANSEPFHIMAGVWDEIKLTYSAAGSAVGSIISYRPDRSENF